MASKFSKGFKIDAKALSSQTKVGKQVFNLDNGDELLKIEEIIDDTKHIAVVNNNRKLLVFELSELPMMQKGKGVILQRQVNSELSDIKLVKLESGLEYNSNKIMRVEKDIRGWLGRRAMKGSMVPFGFKKNNKFN